MPVKPTSLLLVDDETVFRQNLAKILQTRGMLVSQAENGSACLQFLEENPVDIVVLDVKMPGMNGIEVLRHIKEKQTKIEVILLTGQASARDGVDGIKSGAFDYLSKPVEIDHLVGKVRQAHEKIRLEDAYQKEMVFREKMKKRIANAERMAALGTLSAGVAHEINNPLAIIKQSVKWLQLRMRQHTDSEVLVSKTDINKALGNIENSVDRARHITHQLLGSVRNDDVIIAEVDPEKIIDEALLLVEGIASEKGVNIQKKIKLHPESNWGNPGGLRQIITNLLINALHATDTGCGITVSVETSDDRLILAVTDNGTGIPEEHMERIFEPFFTTKPPGEGTGLGLFVIRTILDSLDGVIEVKSKIGQGSSFIVSLPRVYSETKLK
jgi:two-component system, NtrC family, sensor kinase